MMFTGCPASDSNEAAWGSVTARRRTGTVPVFDTERRGFTSVRGCDMEMFTSASAASRLDSAATGGPPGLAAGDGTSVRPGVITSRGVGFVEFEACRAQ